MAKFHIYFEDGNSRFTTDRLQGVRGREGSRLTPKFLTWVAWKIELPCTAVGDAMLGITFGGRFSLGHI